MNTELYIAELKKPAPFAVGEHGIDFCQAPAEGTLTVDRSAHHHDPCDCGDHHRVHNGEGEEGLGVRFSHCPHCTEIRHAEAL